MTSLPVSGSEETPQPENAKTRPDVMLGTVPAEHADLLIDVLIGADRNGLYASREWCKARDELLAHVNVMVALASHHAEPVVDDVLPSRSLFASLRARRAT